MAPSVSPSAEARGALQKLRQLARHVHSSKAWRPPVAAALLHDIHFRRQNEVEAHTEDEHLRAAIDWLGRAQDASRDGGVSGRYSLERGWTSSYPETTGYIVPTLLAVESELGIPGYKDRAGRCIEFLLDIQLPSGAFPGLEIAENRDKPSIFNSAQILNGLTHWHRATGDPRTLAAAHRCVAWLVEMQDADGAWRTHLYGNRTYTYISHASCWLAEFGEHTGHQPALDAARRNLEWVLTHVDPDTGWIDHSGFTVEDHAARRAVTHTIAYTIWGILLSSRILGHERGLSVARTAARAIARRLELSRWIPGRLDWKWRKAADFACLTGNAQMALIWLELHRLDGDPALVSAAAKAIDLVKRAQSLESSDPGIRGGIAGSDPLWGDYITLTYPNWAAKFFIDAVLAKRRALASLSVPHPTSTVSRNIPAGVPTRLPESEGRGGTSAQSVYLLADPRSTKVEQFHLSWKRWDFAPTGVILVERRSEPGRARRIQEHVREFGVGSIIRRIAGKGARRVPQEPRQGTIPTSGMPVADYCAANGIPVIRLVSLDSQESLETLRGLNADLFVYAGCGIMRAATLALPRLGTLNAHMGLLPPMRGMNVAEWSVMYGVPVGPSIHLIDEGIDTGAILLFTPVDVGDASSVDDLRQRVDRVQIDTLGDVVRWTLAHGELPPRREQTEVEGRQYFAMHDDVRNVLQRALR